MENDLGRTHHDHSGVYPVDRKVKAPASFQDEPGRAARMAMERVQRSTHAAWIVDVESRIPVKVQLFVIKLWFAVRGWFV